MTMSQSSFILLCLFPNDTEFELNEPGFADSTIYDLETSKWEKIMKIFPCETSKKLFSYQTLIKENWSTPVVLHNSAMNVLASTEKPKFNRF